MITSLFSLFHSLFFLMAGIIGLGFVISFHELGHFLVAKLFGMRVRTFSIGFGPSLLSKKIGATHFAISAIPLGGYNDFSNPEGQGDDDQSLTSRPYYQKLFVILGGITFNIILAYIIFSLLFMTGMPATQMMPHHALPTISKIEDNSAAQLAGLQVGDTIVAINEEQIVGNMKKLHEIIQSSPCKKIQLVIERNGDMQTLPITTKSMVHLGKEIGIIGTQFTLISLPKKNLIDSIKSGIWLTNKHIIDTFYAFKYILSSGDTTKLAGPVSIFAATSKGAAQGIKIFLIFLAIISVNLAILNLIPLPILDGGQVLFYTIEAIIGRSIPERVREYVFIGTWIGFMLLTLWLIGQDLMRMAEQYIQPVTNLFKFGR